jgi:3D (Asp-Asp-Asp) domain-containing protein
MRYSQVLFLGLALSLLFVQSGASATVAVRDSVSETASDDGCIGPMTKPRSKITEYHSANRRAQHRSVEGRPWTGNKSNRLEACKTIAADQRIYPFGTELFVPALVGMTCKERDGSVVKSDGNVRVADTGVAIHGRGRVDFFVNTRSDECRDTISEMRRVQAVVKKDQGVRFCVRKWGSGRHEESENHVAANRARHESAGHAAN